MRVGPGGWWVSDRECVEGVTVACWHAVLASEADSTSTIHKENAVLFVEGKDGARIPSPHTILATSHQSNQIKTN